MARSRHQYRFGNESRHGPSSVRSNGRRLYHVRSGEGGYIASPPAAGGYIVSVVGAAAYLGFPHENGR